MGFMHTFQDECNYVNYETSQICHGLRIETVWDEPSSHNTDAIDENEPMETLNYLFKKKWP